MASSPLNGPHAFESGAYHPLTSMIGRSWRVAADRLDQPLALPCFLPRALTSTNAARLNVVGPQTVSDASPLYAQAVDVVATHDSAASWIANQSGCAGASSTEASWQYWVGAATRREAGAFRLANFDRRLRVDSPTESPTQLAPHLQWQAWAGRDIPEPAPRPCWLPQPANESHTSLQPQPRGGNRQALKVQTAHHDLGKLYQQQAFRLLAEAAHEIRSPLVSALQILDLVQRRAESSTPGCTPQIDGGTRSLLMVASDRLRKVDRWSDQILNYKRLRESQIQAIPKRFSPLQWKDTISPMLERIARDKHVYVQWIGWESSLPRLYLDPDLLSRVVVNLVVNAVEASVPNSSVFIRVAWQSNIEQRLIIAIEDHGAGLDAEVMRSINATDHSERCEPSLNEANTNGGLGLHIVKGLLPSLGAKLSVQRTGHTSTVFRLSLPVDGFPTLVRNWLLRIGAHAPEGAMTNIHLHALRNFSLDGDELDARLHQAATVYDQVIRIGRDRWLWLECSLSEADQPNRALDPTDAFHAPDAGTCKDYPDEMEGPDLATLVKQLVDDPELAPDPALAKQLHRRTEDCTHGVEGSRKTQRTPCRCQRVFSIPKIPVDTLNQSHDATHRVPGLTQLICSKMVRLAGRRQLILDRLELPINPDAFQALKYKSKRAVRIDSVVGDNLLTPTSYSTRSSPGRAACPTQR